MKFNQKYNKKQFLKHTFREKKAILFELKDFLLLWATQTFSGLGSGMTSFALVLWSYEQKGSALTTSLLMVCSYAPYVILSIFAGALSDRWNKKNTMLVCDTLAALGTLVTLVLLKSSHLEIWHLYVLNVLNGFMNTVQQPASEVATTRILPEKYYQKVGGLRYFSSSVNSILKPILATAVMTLLGMDCVIAFDLLTFIVAFVVLLFFIHIPEEKQSEEKKESLLTSTKVGIQFLRENKGVFALILFLAAINLTASMYEAALPAMVLSSKAGGKTALGLVQSTVGFTTLIGSLFASFLKEPKSRVRVICNTLLFSMSFENFLLAFGRHPAVWCLGAFLGWCVIPVMSTNLEAILRLKIPVELQGRVYAARNTLQFFTIPVGYFLGGFLVDQVFEPIMKVQHADSLLVTVFGSGKGSGASFFFFVIAFVGIGTCLVFRKNPHIWALEKEKTE